MNPSTYELLAGIHAAPGREVLVLPNSPNVILAAERAAELSEQAGAGACRRPRRRRGWPRCWPSTRPRRRGERRRGRARPPERCASAAWRRPPATTPRAASAPATRVGYAGGELVAWGDPAATLAATLERIGAGSELVTCIAGADPPLTRERARAARCPDGVELEYHEGGQPAWWWLLCAE